MTTHEEPTWRREPYRLLFPAGLFLGWAGVLHWLLHSVGWLPDYRPVYHAIAQVQGFMTCFALGFLFTAIPRRTGTAPPASWEMLAALVLPLATTVSAWFGRLATSQLFWLVMVAILGRFIVSRFRSSRGSRRPPNAFIWIPLSLFMGVIGSLMTGAPGILDESWFWVHDLGRLFLLQGLFIGLIVGVGSLALPLILRGEGPADGEANRRDRLVRGGHVVAALVLMASFWIESSGLLRAGYALRGAVVLALLVGVAGIHHLPRVPGWHRRLVWISAWMLPAGYLLAALFPAEKKAGLHVVFIGGFALMALSISLHVIMAHGGDKQAVRGRPWQVPLLGGLMMASLIFRALMDFDQMRFFHWMGAASGAFLLGSLFWASLAAIRIFRPLRSSP